MDFLLFVASIFPYRIILIICPMESLDVELFCFVSVEFSPVMTG